MSPRGPARAGPSGSGWKSRSRSGIARYHYGVRAPGLLLTALLLVPLPAIEGGCTTASYLWEQGRGQLHLLRARRRIRDVLDDPATSEATKARLRLAVRAREFGVRVLGLRGGDAYTRYLDTGDEPIAWSVYAAYPDRLKPFLHHFPIAPARSPTSASSRRRRPSGRTRGFTISGSTRSWFQWPATPRWATRPIRFTRR